MFRYMYFYNGAGIGAGDFNGDGKIDLFFSSNQGTNKLYLNKGGLQFRDVTRQARIPQDGGWSTGVSVADVNSDGLLDIYVCRVGNFEELKGRNQLLVCQGVDAEGVPFYADEAREYGLDFTGFSTQAAFFDYDLDGDLDMYLLNHSVHQNGTFAERKAFAGTYHPLAGDRMYRNENGKFADVTRESGINSSALGYGLGIVVSDINLDGYPDLYIGNDFHENDYLYVNQSNGTFKEDLTNCIEHTSKFSMGVDVADINNDAFPEIISLDMLPADPYILKRSLGDDDYQVHNMKAASGYNPQYAQNALQLNRANGQFSEVAMYANVFATDWSWAPLWIDFDNDGRKDLFVSNGIPKRLNDIDYVSFVTDAEVQSRILANKVEGKDMALIERFPQIKVRNKFYLNRGKVAFEDAEELIAGDRPTYSNGAVYADLDNDGDLDIVVNNIDEPALLYENKTAGGEGGFLQLHLSGSPQNKAAIGARVLVYSGREVHAYEKYSVHGFQSSMEGPVHLGLRNTRVDSIILVWPDNTWQRVESGGRTRILVAYRPGLPHFDYRRFAPESQDGEQVRDVTEEAGLRFRHEENPFVEFDREPLLPFMVSREGPALAVADINGDGLQDVFLGGAKKKKGTVWLQQKSGQLKQVAQPALEADSSYEDVDASWVDVNSDRHPDLVVASGGNEYYGRSLYLLPRVYLNDGHGQLVRLEDAFQEIYLTASSIAASDVNGDGYMDLFVGGRAVPWEYGQTPRSYLLLNDGSGRFHDGTDDYSRELGSVGFVKNAVWHDLDRDGDQDLVLALEWDGITAFIKEEGRLHKKQLTNRKGWWNFVLPCDVDGDGDEDLIAGNTGLNNRLKPNPGHPVRLYYNDFDGNGKKEQLLTYHLGGREIPFASKAELERQIPALKKRFLYAADFARASLEDLFGREPLQTAQVLEADYFANAILLNDGNLNFTLQELPWEAQLSAYKDAAVVDANGDRLPDIFLAGNFYDNNIQMSRYDADYGCLLINQGKGRYVCRPMNGLAVKGQTRRVRKLQVGQGELYILARNNDSALVVKFENQPRSFPINK